MEQLKGDVELCCLADNIDAGWLRYVRNRGYTYSLHGLVHRDYRRISWDEVYRELKLAKNILEDKLEAPITRFIPPKLHCNDTIIEVANSLDMKVDVTGWKPAHVLDESVKTDTVYFHYWKDGFDRVLEL